LRTKTRSQYYKTFIYCHSTIKPSFCVIKQNYHGNVGMARYYKTTPNTAVIYHGNLTLEIVGLKLLQKFAMVIYHGIFIALPP
jgi:hypothetical protein